MKFIWKYVDSSKLKDRHKHSLFLFLNTSFFFILALAATFLMGLWGKMSLDWLLCIIGYITCGLGYIGGIFYLFKVG